MRNFCIAMVAAGLTFAQAAWADPLAPGKPAGVRQAQMWDDSTTMIIIGVAVAAAAIAAGVSSGNGSGPTSVTTSPVVSTSTTG
ncbi:MAG TPA: hypothetical protein VHX18_09840 [Rhizomicrobium sp.]|jgi:hypothetical protein|nr:hypothetical protein [Rhizomicrobium sp.]